MLSKYDEANYIPAKAIVTDIVSKGPDDGSSESSKYTQIEFAVDGNTVNIELRAYNSLWDIGDEIDIQYHKENPHKVRSSLFNIFFMAIFAGLGTVFALISTALLVYVFKEKKEKLTADSIEQL